MGTIYADALAFSAEQAKGLTITHQGGEAYAVDPLTLLRRFLILGSENGSFYVNARDLTAQSVQAVQDALAADPMAAIDAIVEVSVQARAPKQEPALLALALAASHEDQMVRAYALAQLPQVARIGTHLFTFVDYVSQLRGWGTALRRALAGYYLDRDPTKVAYDVTKYQQRGRWSHRDVLRIAHPKPRTEVQRQLFRYIAKGELPAIIGCSESTAYLAAVEEAKTADEANTIDLITRYNLPREVVATRHLNSPAVWEALLYAPMPLTAMLRNLGNMSKMGLLTPLSDAAAFVGSRLRDREVIQYSRAHPITVLKARFQYGAGRGRLGSGQWMPVQTVVDTLDGTFDLAFANVVPSGKRLLLALDVSSSMTTHSIDAIPGFTNRVAAAAMALVTLRTEPNYIVTAFSHQLQYFNLSPSDSLATVVSKMASVPFGATYCNLPMEFASNENLPVDAFLIYTDNETGGYNPMRALREYRRRSGIPDAKLAVVAMALNEFSIADPTDPNTLDVAGFDTAVPAVLSEFVRGI